PVEQDRLVRHRHELLRARVSDRSQPAPHATRQDETLHRADECGTFPSLSSERSLRSLSPLRAARRWRFPRPIVAQLRALASLAVSAACGSSLALPSPHRRSAPSARFARCLRCVRLVAGASLAPSSLSSERSLRSLSPLRAARRWRFPRPIVAQ